MADALCKFISVEVDGYGKQSDGGTFRSSQLYQLMKARELFSPDRNLPDIVISMPYLFVGN